MCAGALQLRVNCELFGCIESLQIAVFIAACGGYCCVHTHTTVANIHCFGKVSIELEIGPACL